MRTKSYRIQKRYSQRGWGYGKVNSYSKWVTFPSFFEDLDSAIAYAKLQCSGLSQVRVLYGKEVVFSKEG